MPEIRKPDGWEKLPRDGSSEGALVGYCPKKPGNFHVAADGGIVWHEIPAGYHFEKGALVPKVPDPESVPATAPAGPPLPLPSSIPAAPAATATAIAASRPPEG